MKPDRKSLRRLDRLEHLRAIARRQALSEAGRAEAHLARTSELGERTAALIAGYAAARDAACGADLARQRQFVAALQRLAHDNSAEIARARAQADTRAAEAAAAERRRAAVETRADAARRLLQRDAATSAQPLGGKTRPRS